MKYLFLPLGIAAAFAVNAQSHTHAVSYQRSAFANMRNIAPAQPIGAQHRQSNANVQQHFPGWSFATDKIGKTINDMYGPALAIQGADLPAKAVYCMDHMLAEAGIVSSEWQQTRNTRAGKASFVDYVQYIGGHKVVFSKMSFRFTANDQLMRIRMSLYGEPGTSTSPSMDAQTALQSASEGMNGAGITAQSITGDWAWFPIPTAHGYVLHPAWPFAISGKGEDGFPIELTGYVDATNGAVLYRTNQVKETVDVTVKTDVNKINPTLGPATTEALSNLQITVNNVNYNTDANGFLSISSLNAPIVATVKLQGKWSKVNAGSSSGATPSFNDTITANGTTFTFPQASPSSSRHVNAYYHVNRVHDFMKGYFPNFTGMDVVLPTNVDVSGTCNAFYNGSSINFYAAGGGCVSFADLGDVVYHEYGHGISDKFYNAQGAGTINNGALNEANSDIWGISITHDPVLGRGSSPGTGTYIRRYDLAPKVYPQDIEGEVHADGEIIAGAWWDVAVNLNSVDSMTKLFTSTYFDVPDGPDGSEGQVYHDVLISALMNDDDDNLLSNGTPHFNAIVTAFARHGIYLLADAQLTHTEIAHQPRNTPIPVTAKLSVSNPEFLQALKLYYSVRGTAIKDSITLTDNGGLNFSGQIPGQPEGSIIDYYFSVQDILLNNSAYFPATYNPVATAQQTSIPYQFGVGIAAVDSNQFEGSVAGWTIGNVPGDNATAGIWIQAVPIGSSVNSASVVMQCQTNNDHTYANGTGKCLVTGNAANALLSINAADVDGGTTTVQTPVFDLTNYKKPIIEYYRWYGNDMGNNPRNDQWLVQIQDSAASAAFWYPVEKTYQSDYSWRRKIFAVGDYINLANSTKHVRMRFVAADAIVAGTFQQGQSTVEAAVDDFFIYDQKDFSGVNEVAVAKAEVYPNPADETLRIKLPVAAAGSISLYDITGRVLKAVATDAASTIYTIDTKSLAAGQYLLVIKTYKTIQTKKVVVAH